MRRLCFPMLFSRSKCNMYSFSLRNRQHILRYPFKNSRKKGRDFHRTAVLRVDTESVLAGAAPIYTHLPPKVRKLGFIHSSCSLITQ